MRAALPLLLLAGPALAQPDPGVEAALGAALEEQRLLAACLSLTPEAADLRAELWAEAAAATVEALEREGYDAGATARFRDGAASIEPAPDTPFSQVRDLCRTQAEAFEALRARWSATFEVTPLPDALPAPYGSSNE